MGVSPTILKGKSTDKCSKLDKFCRMLQRDPLVSVWFENMGRAELSQTMRDMLEIIEKDEWTKAEIFNLHRSINPSVRECERFIHIYKKVFCFTEADSIFFNDFKASVEANYNTPWSKFYKKAKTSPLLWRRFRDCKHERIMKMCVKMDMLIKGMLSEREMHELGEKHHGYKITEPEFTAFWETFVSDCQNRFKKDWDSKQLESCKSTIPKNSLSVNRIKEDWPKVMEISPRKGQRQRKQLMRIKLASKQCPYTVTPVKKQPTRPQSRRSMVLISNNLHKHSFSPLRLSRFNRKLRLPPSLSSPFKRSPFKQERADVYSHPQS